MKRREGKSQPSTTELLVCFPSTSRTRLTMPKALCSPSRSSDLSKRHHHHNHHHHHRQASSWLSKTKSDADEPSSPKVTCAGQIKVRSQPNSSCKNWQSVMEEIERIHNRKHEKKRHTWVETLGLKKEIMQFLTCLRTVRLDFRCFGSFSNSYDDDEDFEESHLSRATSDDSTVSSRAAFSNWFMVLQEDTVKGIIKNSQYKFSDPSYTIELNNEFEGADNNDMFEINCAPPSNALLLTRSKSDPLKSWLEEMKENEEYEEKKGELVMNEEEKRLVLMKYNNEFDMLSTDIVKETWVVSGIKDAVSVSTRSRSWKR